jgi:hypothetical protein
VILNSRSYQVKRFTRTIQDGVVVESEDDDFTVVGNLQPLNDRELNAFPEGFRPRAAWKFYTSGDVDLRLGGIDPSSEEDNEPDRLVMSDGRLLYVHGVEDWESGLISHRKWILVEAETNVGQVDPDV